MLAATLKDDTTDNKQTFKRQKKNANLSQNKKSCNPTHKPTLAAHFILPNRTQAHPPPEKWTVDSLKGFFDKIAA